MASTAAQDEYDHMFRTQNAHQQHPEDRLAAAQESNDHDHDGDSNLSDDDDAENAASLAESAYPSAPTHSYSRSRTYLPNQRSYNNTGPKGVIADAQAFREAEKAHRESLNITRSSVNPHAQPYIENLSLNDSAHGGDSLKEDKDEDGEGRDDANEADEELEEEESEFMREWREQRLIELRGKSVIASNSAADRWGMGRTAKLVYEGLTQVDGEGFLEVVDGSPRGVVVVVFVWDDRSEVSSMVEECIRQMARKHKTTRFIKLHYQDAEMEPAGVPAVLAYRGGDKFAGLVPIVDEIPDDADLSAETLEKLFQRHQIL